MTSKRQLPPIERRTVSAAFERALEYASDKEFLRYERISWTFKEAYVKSAALGSGLRGLGIQQGEPVGLLLDNSPDFVFSWLGIALNRLRQVPFNTALRGKLLAHVINDSNIQSILIEDKYIERLLMISDDIPKLSRLIVRGNDVPQGARARFNIIEFEEVATSGSSVNLEHNRPDEIIGYFYTSGTTGPSKGAVLSHVHAYTYASEEDAAHIRSTDVDFQTLPLFHITAQWMGIYRALIHNITCVLEPRFSASSFWEKIRENSVTTTTLLGSQAEILQQQPASPEDSNNPLRLVGMAPLPADLAGFRSRFGVQARPAYGMTEIGRVVSGKDPADTRPGEAGVRREGYELKIVDEHGEVAPVGTPGELWVRPENRLMVMLGYHNLPCKTAEVIDEDGWLHTGDVLKVDEEGHYYFIDRLKDALRRRGENVSSFEVESALNEHPSVRESAVVGVKSDVGEDDIKAFVVPVDSQTYDPVEVIQFLADRIPYFMVPRYLECVDALPKTPTHKIQKSKLRESGNSNSTWDSEAVGVRVTREGFVAGGAHIKR